MVQRYAVYFVCFAVLTLPCASSAQVRTPAWAGFVDGGPRALGMGQSLWWNFGSIAVGPSFDFYVPYERPASAFGEIFAVVRWDVPHSSWMIFVNVGVGWAPSPNTWSPRGFLVATMRTRVAPWINVFTSVPLDDPSNTYTQARVGMRIGVSGPLSLLAYVEAPLTPTLQLPFQNKTNQAGFMLTLVP